MNDKIMAGDTLENIVYRLSCGVSLVNMLSEVPGGGAIPEEAIRGVGDLFEAIVRDFRAGIDSAEDYQEPPRKKRGSEKEATT